MAASARGDPRGEREGPQGARRVAPYLARRCIRPGPPKLFAQPVFFKFAFLSCILLLVGALVAFGDCIKAGRPGPASEPSVLSAPAPEACAIANPQLAASNAAANINFVAFNNIADSPLCGGPDGNVRQPPLVPRRCVVEQNLALIARCGS